MARTLVTALVVSGLGMLALFLAMCLLYGLMYGMTAFIKHPSTPAPDEGGDSASPGDREAEARRRAAAIAVALARAEQDVGPVEAPETDEGVSAWWTLQQHNQLTRGRPRHAAPRPREWSRGSRQTRDRR